MNLIIDIGNTSVKAALASEGVIVCQERFGSADPEVFGRFAGHHRLKGVIVSSVGGDPSALLAFFGTRAERVHHLSSGS